VVRTFLPQFRKLFRTLVNEETFITYFIHMITSCKWNYFLIRMGVLFFSHFTLKTQQSLLSLILLQVTLACHSYLDVRHGQLHMSHRNFLLPCRISTMSNFRHAELINTSTMPSSPRHAGIFSNFSRHAGTITNFFSLCEIIFLKGHTCQYWLIFNHQI
jgi:hypothetical protein